MLRRTYLVLSHRQYGAFRINVRTYSPPSQTESVYHHVHPDIQSHPNKQTAS